MMTETVVTVEPSNRPPASQPQAQPQKTSATELNWLKFNIDYYKTIPGILKLVQLILGILCMALASPAILSGTHWFLFVAVTSFIATLLWVFVYLLGIREVLNLPINWILTELINTGIITLLYFIAFVVQLSALSGWVSNWKGANIAAGVFGIFNTIAYGAGTYFLYLEHKSAPSA